MGVELRAGSGPLEWLWVCSCVLWKRWSECFQGRAMLLWTP